MTPCTISFTDAAIADPTYRWDDNRNKTSEAIGGSMSGYGFSVGGSGFGEDDTYADVFSVSVNPISEDRLPD